MPTSIFTAGNKDTLEHIWYFICLSYHLQPSLVQSYNWDKGKLQMKEIRPSPSGVPRSGFLLLLWLRRRGPGPL